jgi:hypothetical protein
VRKRHGLDELDADHGDAMVKEEVDLILPSGNRKASVGW